ncbi:ABC transporter family protein [Mycobacterium xenopi 3993]|nr:ABC transporter family protein [Mycobacterium xenopi 3993]
MLLGPSGTGKSVFLKSLIGLLKPERGSIIVDGTDITECSAKELYEIRRLFGVMFQDGALFGSMNIYDNTAFPLREHTKKKESEIRDIVMEKLEMVGLAGDEKKFPGEISGVCASAPGWPARWCWTRDHPVRRARLRFGPGAHRVSEPAADRHQRPDRLHDPDRHAQHQHRAHRAGQHRHAVSPQAGDVRAS